MASTAETVAEGVKVKRTRGPRKSTRLALEAEFQRGVEFGRADEAMRQGVRSGMDSSAAMLGQTILLAAAFGLGAWIF